MTKMKCDKCGKGRPEGGIAVAVREYGWQWRPKAREGRQLLCFECSVIGFPLNGGQPIERDANGKWVPIDPADIPTRKELEESKKELGI